MVGTCEEHTSAHDSQESQTELLKKGSPCLVSPCKDGLSADEDSMRATAQCGQSSGDRNAASITDDGVSGQEPGFFSARQPT